MERTITMTLEKETKGALKYQENPTPGKANLMNNLYLRKDAMEGSKPTTISITVEEAE